MNGDSAKKQIIKEMLEDKETSTSGEAVAEDLDGS
jgi:hypothetical protein